MISGEDLSGYWPIHKKLREIFADVDLVYIHFPFYLGMKAMRVAKQMGKPVVVGFHLQPENLLMNIGRVKGRVLYYPPWMKKSYSSGSDVIVSEFE